MAHRLVQASTDITLHPQTSQLARQRKGENQSRGTRGSLCVYACLYMYKKEREQRVGETEREREKQRGTCKLA